MANTLMNAVTLFAPKVQYASTFDSQFDAMTTWRADIECGYVDDGDAPHVVAGYAEFVNINIGQHPIVDLLDSLSEDALAFEKLFEGDDVGPALQEQFEDAPIHRVMIITAVEIAEPLQGLDLEAWLVAEIIARMTSPIDTLVLLHPHGLGPLASSDADPTFYWQRCGLTPVKHQPHFLCATTAYTHLPNARDTLRPVGDVQITVPASLIRVEQPDSPRHTIMTDPQPEPVCLRLVRD